jgi:catechol 2,3-dioxygenase-like lactoylglutathione lyase family enzyme
MIRGIHHIGIHTPDLDRLRSFYEEAFGFEAVGEEFNLKDAPEAPLIVGLPNAAARVVMMKAHNCFIELFEWSSPAGTTLAPAKPYDFGYTHFMLDVSDIDAEYERLSKLGMTFVHPAPVRFGRNASVYGKDPDGNIIELAEIPPGESMHLEVGD